MKYPQYREKNRLEKIGHKKREYNTQFYISARLVDGQPVGRMVYQVVKVLNKFSTMLLHSIAVTLSERQVQVARVNKFWL